METIRRKERGVREENSKRKWEARKAAAARELKQSKEARRLQRIKEEELRQGESDKKLREDQERKAKIEAATKKAKYRDQRRILYHQEMVGKNKARANELEKRLAQHQEMSSQPRRPPKNKVTMVSKSVKKMEPKKKWWMLRIKRH